MRKLDFSPEITWAMPWKVGQERRSIAAKAHPISRLASLEENSPHG